jgi:type IV secretory pathway VirD2 relaxase
LLRLAQSSAHRLNRGNQTWRAAHGRSGATNYKQRCAVRVTYSQNKTAGQWKAHGHYIARETATEKSKARTAGFDAKESRVDIAQRLETWQRAGDQRLFKLIISPEFGDRMDLEAHTRALLKCMERDLHTKLEWAAAVHYNTDHPHVHVVLRGRDEQGEALRLPREYVQSGIRSHAEDIATKQLGYRTERDAVEAQRREVPQLRFTTLDRMIQRHNPQRADYFTLQRDPTRAGLQDFSRAQEHNLAARLAKLQQMGLAEGLGHYTWRVRGDFGQLLRTMQKSSDRQRMLARHGALLSDERLPLEFVSFRQLTQVNGRVVAHGQEEDTDRMYLMVEGVDGKVHLLYQNEDIQNARHKGQLAINSFVRIEKRFSQGRPFLQVNDLGDAYQLLKNSTYFRSTASLLTRQGIHNVEPTWGGWLGQYQDAVREYLSAVKEYDRGRGR